MKKRLRLWVLFTASILFLMILMSCGTLKPTFTKTDIIGVDTYIFNQGRKTLSDVSVSTETISEDGLRIAPGEGFLYHLNLPSNSRLRVEYPISLLRHLKGNFPLPNDGGPLIILLADADQPVGLTSGIRTVPSGSLNGRLPFGSIFSDNLVHGLVEIDDIKRIQVYCWGNDRPTPTFWKDLDEATYVFVESPVEIRQIIIELEQAQLEVNERHLDFLEESGLVFFEAKDGRRGFFRIDYKKDGIRLSAPSYPAEFGSHPISLQTRLPTMFLAVQQACREKTSRQ